MGKRLREVMAPPFISTKAEIETMIEALHLAIRKAN
jgi:adenosylmethionine-8-amino-7-oxononanoate aminotransferase